VCIKANWISVDEKHKHPFDLKNKADWEKIRKNFDFCLSGDALEFLVGKKLLSDVLAYVSVFARSSPEQKVRTKSVDSSSAMTLITTTRYIRKRSWLATVSLD